MIGGFQTTGSFHLQWHECRTFSLSMANMEHVDDSVNEKHVSCRASRFHFLCHLTNVVELWRLQVLRPALPGWPFFVIA